MQQTHINIRVTSSNQDNNITKIHQPHTIRGTQMKEGEDEWRERKSHITLHHLGETKRCPRSFFPSLVPPKREKDTWRQDRRAIREKEARVGWQNCIFFHSFSFLWKRRHTKAYNHQAGRGEKTSLPSRQISERDDDKNRPNISMSFTTKETVGSLWSVVRRRVKVSRAWLSSKPSLLLLSRYDSFLKGRVSPVHTGVGSGTRRKRGQEVRGKRSERRLHLRKSPVLHTLTLKSLPFKERQ